MVSIKTTLLLLAMTTGLLARAQPLNEENYRARPTQQQSGQLFSLRFDPNAGRLKVLAVGHQAAELTPDQIKILGKTYSLKGHASDLQFVWVGDSFYISNQPKEAKKIEIEVTDKKSQKSESFQFPTLKTDAH